MTPEMMQTAMRDALAEARHDGGEALRKVTRYVMAVWDEEWKLEYEPPFGDGVRKGVGHTAVVDPSGRWMLSACGYDIGSECDGTPEERLARARLAAAAPDMARALQRLANWVNLDALGTFEGDPLRSEKEGKDAFMEAVRALEKAGVRPPRSP